MINLFVILQQETEFSLHCCQAFLLYPVIEIAKFSATEDQVEKARVIDPFGHAGLTPLGEIRLTLAGEIKMRGCCKIDVFRMYSLLSCRNKKIGGRARRGAASVCMRLFVSPEPR